MVSEIRIYVEGGGDFDIGKASLRKGFSQFLRKLVELARQRRIKWSIIACGSRNNAFRDFKNALNSHPNAFNVLLVDAEAPVQSQLWQHLQQRDPSWSLPDDVGDDQCHLMVQTMEAWLVADLNALARFYGQGFNTNALPSNRKVEELDKKVLEKALIRATQRTQAGTYHKIRHGPKLLGVIDTDIVCCAAPSCERLFKTLRDKLGL